jgi:hypothetical protein
MTLQEFAIYAIAVLCIGFMFILCMDVVKRNNDRVYSYSLEAVKASQKEKIAAISTIVEEKEALAAATKEKPLVNPFYVDCSEDLIAKQH